MMPGKSSARCPRRAPSRAARCGTSPWRSVSERSRRSPRAAARRSARGERSSLYLEDVHVGQRFESRVHQLDAEQIKAFAADYDPQPFHLSDEGAAGTIFETLTA